MSTPFQVMMMGSLAVKVPLLKLWVRTVGFMRGCVCNPRAGGRACGFAGLRGGDSDLEGGAGFFGGASGGDGGDGRGGDLFGGVLCG